MSLTVAGLLAPPAVLLLSCVASQLLKSSILPGLPAYRVRLLGAQLRAIAVTLPRPCPALLTRPHPLLRNAEKTIKIRHRPCRSSHEGRGPLVLPSTLMSVLLPAPQNPSSWHAPPKLCCLSAACRSPLPQAAACSPAPLPAQARERAPLAEEARRPRRSAAPRGPWVRPVQAHRLTCGTPCPWSPAAGHASTVLMLCRIRRGPVRQARVCLKSRVSCEHAALLAAASTDSSNARRFQPTGARGHASTNLLERGVAIKGGGGPHVRHQPPLEHAPAGDGVGYGGGDEHFQPSNAAFPHAPSHATLSLSQPPLQVHAGPSQGGMRTAKAGKKPPHLSLPPTLIAKLSSMAQRTFMT